MRHSNNDVTGETRNGSECHALTSRQRDEMALFQIFFEESRDGLVVLREDGGVYCTNARFAVMHGYTLAEVEQLYLWNWNSQYEKSRLLEILRSVPMEGEHFETRHRCKDGRTIDVEVATNATYLHGQKLIFCHCRDITQRNLDRERIHYLATTDPLTGLANRREFMSRCEAEVARARRFHRPLALIIYDLDHFKRINDTFGHNVGDRVLQAATKQIHRHIRQEDLHARWGGEEFILLMPECGLDAAMASAERLRRAIAQYAYPHQETVSASFGITVLAEGDEIDGLIKRADDALYRAKAAGRNRAEIERPDVSSA
ncbi:sensor domain-containing diguanylate cyclase [Halomonas lysinitropha]|uniref:diguanylate cyclase n=1 Tax=Halomonas lysinitropha TaxID=2607506 RepID=A0A5K1I3E4_9GAMM|nr:sensor domain-containing diguanylate cyclase [Halomonas lysinitropha]VVZ94941.1 putative diguanylate cyclase YdaM [Halomonas lysinitropha]